MDSQRLAQMVNQIARNLTAQGEAEAVMQTAKHIRDFWDPRMRAALLTMDLDQLDPLARKAVATLKLS